MSKRIVVVGHGMVGQRFLETLTQDGPSDFAITMLAEEPRLAYDRVNLSKYLLGLDASKTSRSRRASSSTRTASSCIPAIRWRRSIAPTNASPRKAAPNTNTTSSILATGSSPFVPPIPGPRPPRRVRLSHHRRSRSHQRSRQEFHARRGHRRRPARPRSREGAQGSRPRHQRGRVRAAGSWPCRWTRAAAACCARASKRSASPCTPARTPRASTTANPRAIACISPTAARSKPTWW